VSDEEASGDGFARTAVALHREREGRGLDRLSLQWGVVTAVSGGLVALRPLAAVDPTTELYAHVGPVLPQIGDNVLYALLGTSWIVLGVIRSATHTGQVFDGPFRIDYDGTIMRLRRADGTDVVIVDTTAAILSLRNGFDFATYRDAGGSIPTHRVDGQNGALYGGGTAPTIAVGAALGSGATASVLWGNDAWMYLILNPGTSGTAAGTAATITLPNARPNGNYGVWLNPISSKAMDTGGAYAGASTTATFIITFRVAPSAGGTMHYLASVAGMGA
jgi:hypothetical protein